MPKPLVFLFGDQEYPLHLNKVDRSKLYGSKDVEAVDENDDCCELATLADDGRTMIGRGGTGLGWIDADGKWREKSELTPHDVDGDEIQPVKSSFNAPIKLFDTATEEEYLAHNVRLVYCLEFEGPGETDNSAKNLDELMGELSRGTIFKFPYSYRGGLEADAAFMLLNADKQVMLAVGNPTEISFIGIQSQPVAVEPADTEQEVDLMDFDMI